LTPAKLLAMTAIDLLHGDAASAQEILAQFNPAMTKKASLPGVSARPLSDRAFHLHRGMMDADRNSIEARGCVMLYSSVTARGTICYAAALHFCCVPKKNPGLTGMAARAAS